MSPALYRRHSASCAVHTLPLSPREKRHYDDCECPIWIYGRIGDVLFPRQSLGTNDMKVAKVKQKAMIREAERDSADAIVLGPRIDECIEKFLGDRRFTVGERPLQNYQRLLGRLITYCEERSCYHMSGLSVDLIEEFKVNGLPRFKDTTRAIAVAKLRCFLREALRRGWLKDPLAERVRPLPAEPDQKKPYSDAEVNSILEGSLKFPHSRNAGYYSSRPETFRRLLELMLETGMRVGDAIAFNPRLLRKGDHLWIYTFTQIKRKKGRPAGPIEAYIQDRLKLAIDKCQWLSPELPFSVPAASKYQLEHQVYDLMQMIGKRCGIEDCRPHRLRDTFAVRNLLRGVPIGDVSRLLGHASVKITEKYYAAWNTARARRLESVVAQSLVNSGNHVSGD